MKHFLLKVLLLCLFIAPAAAQAPLHLQIVDGKTSKAILQINPSQKSISNDGISVQTSYSSANGNSPETWKYTIKNNSTGDRWLYLNWQLSWDQTADINNLHYWGGRGDAVSGETLLRHPYVDGEMNATMLQAIYNDKNGLALALPPMQIVSALNQSLLTKDQKYFLQLQIPLALSAGESDTFPIEIYRFTPRYGYLDALQKYFSAHPAAFNARTNIDSRAAGVGASRAWEDLVIGGLSHIDDTGLLKATEKARRFCTDWEWFYAPFRRTGDIYTRDEYWDYKPVRPFNYFRDQPSAEKFREFRHHLLENVDKAGPTPAYYVPAFSFSDIELAKAQYPDAIIYKPDGSYARLYTTPWVIGSDHEVEMYPWGNKFAQQSMADAKQVVAENPVTAFAYDIMAGGTPFRGKGMKESPRRAFDKDGEYADTAVAIAKMADYTRSLEKDGKKVGLVGNITSKSRPFLVARSDTLMCEQAPYFYGAQLYNQDGSLEALRLAAGHKLITFWAAWRLPDLINIDEMTPQQIRAAYQGAADMVRLSCYRFGAYPSIRFSAGVPQMVKMLPLLKEVISQGWQAVPAVRGVDGDLPNYIWAARYGSDVNSYITLGNAQKSAWTGNVIIDNDYLGNSNYLFVAQNAGKVLSQSIKGRTTILRVEIPAHETLVLRAVATLPASASENAAVSWNDDGAKGNLIIKSTFNPTKVLSPSDGWELKNHDGDNWHFASRYFNSPVNDLQNFPYFKDAQTAQIVLPENSTTDEQWAAQRIQDYFQFWGKFCMTPAKEVNLSIVKKVDASHPAILIGGAKIGVTRNAQTLTIGTQNIREVTLALLQALDQKYFYCGTLPTTGSDGEALKKAGLAGKTLT